MDNVSGSTHDSQRPFKFGDGEFVYSFKNATISVIIGKTKCRIDTEVVKSRHSTTTEQVVFKESGYHTQFKCACCSTPTQQMFIYIMARTSYFSMK